MDKGQMWLSPSMINLGLPRWLSGTESVCQCRRFRRCGFSPWVGKISWRRKWQSTPVFLPGEFHGQRSLAVYSPWDREESDVTKHTYTHDKSSHHFKLKDHMMVEVTLRMNPPSFYQVTHRGAAGMLSTYWGCHSLPSLVGWSTKAQILHFSWVSLSDLKQGLPLWLIVSNARIRELTNFVFLRWHLWI